jgi:hypothetical protein
VEQNVKVEQNAEVVQNDWDAYEKEVEDNEDLMDMEVGIMKNQQEEDFFEL